MIEDPNLTRQILEYFAQDDVAFPANKTVRDDLTRTFPDDEPSCGYVTLEASTEASGVSSESRGLSAPRGGSSP